MKSAGLLFSLLLAITRPTVAQTAAPATPPAAVPAATSAAEIPAKLSPGISQMLADNLPKYTAPVAAKSADPEVLELPKVTVTQKKRPRLNDQVMMTNKAFNEKLAKEQLSSFDRNFLNKFTLPLFGVSAADRAREEYDRAQREQLQSDVAHLAKVAEQIDPAQAKALRDAAAKP
jgi:hypothetical protein